MNQALIQTLAEIGVDVSANDTQITICAINQERLRVAAHVQWAELAAMVAAAGFDWDELSAMGCEVELGDEYHFVLRTIDQAKLTAARKAAELADFNRWMRQAEAEWQEDEERDDDPLDYLLDD